HGDLEEINEGVVAADVGKLVSDDRGELRFAEAGERGDRQKNDGANPADHRGGVQLERLAIPNEARETHAALQGQATFEECGAQWRGIAAAEAFESDDAAGRAQA